MTYAVRRHPKGSRQGGQFAPDRRGAQPPATTTAPNMQAGTAEPDKNTLIALAETWAQLHDEDDDSYVADLEELEWANTYHLRFARFNARTVKATQALLDLRPSQLSPQDKQKAFSDWLTSVARAYRMKPVALAWDEQAALAGGGFYQPASHTLTLNPRRPSVITLLHEMRHALQYQGCGAPMITDDVERDARAWSLSLYFQVRPDQFERLVRQGQIRFVDRRAFN